MISKTKCYNQVEREDGGGMKSIHVQLPEKTATELESLVQMGWFTDQGEAIRVAISEYLNHNRLALIERFQEEDIQWAMEQKKDD
jgi:Arc/MetJ-type ribon-helix-helix transcriptional regulator